MQNKNLQIYLKSIAWETRTFSNEQLELKLVAAMLRYLGGITELSFVLHLAEEIRGKYSATNLPLHYTLEMLHDITQEIANNRLLLTDTKILKGFINDAQKIITKKDYI